MDEGPIVKDKVSPKGYYEDQRLVEINKGALSRWQLGTNNSQRIDKKWAVEFAQWVTYRTIKYKDQQWGFKEPRMIGFTNWWIQFFNDPILIHCIRSDEQIIKSQVTKLGMPIQDAINGVGAYRKLIKQHLSKHKIHKIDLTHYQPEDELTERLRGLCNKWQ